MNPNTNKLEQLHRDLTTAAAEGAIGQLLRPDGTPVPKHWSTFAVDEHVVIKDYTFRVAYMNETTVVLEPVGPVIVGEQAPAHTVHTPPKDPA